MLRVWAQPLRRQLFVAILLLVVPMLAAAVWFGFATYRERAEELRDQAQVQALRAAASIERELTGLDRMARNLSTNPVVQRLESAAVEPLLRPQRLQRPSLLDLVLVDRSGAAIARGAADPNISEDWMPLVAPVFAQGARVVLPMQAAGGQLNYVTIGYPVRDASGSVVAALACFIDPQLMQDAFGLLLLPPDSVVTVTEENGRVLARSLQPERFVGQVVEAETSGGYTGAASEREGMDGVRRMYGAALVAGGPWVVSVGIPTSVAFDRAISLWGRTLAVLGLGLAGWLTVAFVLSRRLGESLSHLDAAAQRIAAGDFSPLERKPMPTREFAELQDAFDRMLHRFNETRAALDQQIGKERRISEELQSLQGQVIRQERLAAVGQLVSGVAHEINNPLQAILGFAELLQMQADVPEAVKADLHLIQKESARACGIIRNLALFARQQTGEAAPVRLADVIASVVELRQRRLESENIQLRVDDASQHHVLAVLTELQQVVLNFVVNAEQALVMSGRQPGQIAVRTRDVDDRVVLEVEDTGPGIPPELEARLFQPFFTTKPVGQGTGLGLSVSYGIVDSLGGRIGYRRAPAGGAIFFFDLPAASSR